MQNYHGGEGADDKEELLNFRADELLAEGDEDDSDQWVATHLSSKGTMRPYIAAFVSNKSWIVLLWPPGAEGERSRRDAEDIPDIPDIEGQHSAESGLEGKVGGLHIQDSHHDVSAVPDVDDIPDIDDEDDDYGVTEPEDEAVAATTSHAQVKDARGNTLSVRTYDCYITYDKFYQTPRLWLSGLSPSRQPLTKDDVFQDVAADYAQKTVTFEPFPHRENSYMASVHPCKHANVMKKVIERMNTAVREAQLRQAALEESSNPASQDTSEAVKEKKKKGWGITSAVKKAAGVAGSSSNTPQSPPAAGEEVEGLRVDQCKLACPQSTSSVYPILWPSFPLRSARFSEVHV
jgi:ubiquitin-like-conjugating enzyme ATG3